MTTEDGDVDPADQHSSNQRFRSGDTSGAGEPEITSTAGDNQHLYTDIKNLQEAVSLPLTHSLPPLQSSSSIPMWHSFLTFEIVSFLHYVKLVLNCSYHGEWLRISVVLHSTATSITGKMCMRNELNQFDGEQKHFPVKRRIHVSKRTGLFHQKNNDGNINGEMSFTIFLAMCDVHQHLGVATGVTDPTTESPFGCVFCL